MSKVKSRSISPAQLATLLSTGNTHELLDVRTNPEYVTAHVPGARLIPLNKLKINDLLLQHKLDTPIYLLCHSGARAASAIEQLELAGCRDGVLVEGGTQAWIDAGLPVHRGTSTVIPIMRQVQIVAGSLSATGAILALSLSSWFALLPLFLGCGLLFAGLTGTCGMALLLVRMPWNRTQSSSSHCCTPE